MVARSHRGAQVALLGLLATASAMPSAHADGEVAARAPRAGDSIPPPPAIFPGNDVTVAEQPRALVPMDAPLRTLDGAATTLGQAIAGDLPTILTFNYSNCPNLCSLQLGALSSSLTDVRWRLGRQFRIITIVLDPSESTETTTATRARYVASLPEGSDPAGWTFLLAPTQAARPADDATVRRIADAVGFHYTFLADEGQFAHPAALTFLSSDGKVMQYMYGAQFEAKEIDTSIIQAGFGAPSTAVGFMYRCLHWDPGAKSHASEGRSLLRYGAAGFVALMVIILGFFHIVRRTRVATPGAVRS